MQLQRCAVMLLLAALCLNVKAQESKALSRWSVAVDYLYGKHDIQGLKFAGQYHTDWLEQYSPSWHVFFEMSANTWRYGPENKTDVNLVAAVSPVFQYQFYHWQQRPIYFELGIGFAWLNTSTIAGVNVGSRYQFEDRLGFGVRFGEQQRHQLALRYIHYSNGGLERPNPGLDFATLSYMYRF